MKFKKNSKKNKGGSENCHGKKQEKKKHK